MVLVVTFVGLCVGSFFNVLLVRYPHWRGVISGHSRCPHCRRTLTWYELIPLASFLVLRGRCRTCAKPISWQYPLVESTTAMLLLGFWIRHGVPHTPQEILWLVLLLGFALLFYFDFRSLILPDVVIGTMALATLLIYAVWYPARIIPGILTGFLTGLPFGILYIVSRGRLVGFGDVKLIFLIGLAIGFPFGTLAVVVAIWIATLVAGVLLLLGRATMKTALPFGVFLSGVSIAYILFANYVEIFRWIFI